MPERTTRLAVFCAAAALLGAKPVHAISCQDWRDLGDVTRIALPAAAYGATLGHWDGEGAFQYTKQLALTGIGAGTFKLIGDKTRPDAGVSRQSFVSGHVAAAFSGASFLYTRYSRWLGVPAYALAFANAYSRVCAQKHFDDDVLGGAMVAMMANWWAVSPYEGTGRIYPTFTSNGIGIGFSQLLGGNKQPRDRDNFKPRYRVVFEFGPVVTDKNIVRAPSNSPDTLDLAALENEFTFTARFQYEYYMGETSTWGVHYDPFGSTDFASTSESFRFGGREFVPDDESYFDTNYRTWDLRPFYKYKFFDNERFEARVGVGLQWTSVEVEIEQKANEDGALIAGEKIAEDLFFPTLHLSAGYRLADRWRIEGEVDGMSLDNTRYLNAAVWLRWQPTPIWDMAVGGRLKNTRVDEAGLFNEAEFSDISFQLARSF